MLKCKKTSFWNIWLSVQMEMFSGVYIDRKERPFLNQSQVCYKEGGEDFYLFIFYQLRDSSEQNLSCDSMNDI